MPIVGYGVVCKAKAPEEALGAETFFGFASVTQVNPVKQIEFPCLPLDGLTCPICRRLAFYSSDNVLEVASEVLLFPV